MSPEFFTKGKRIKRKQWRKNKFVTVTGVGRFHFLAMSGESEFQFSLSGDWVEV